MKPLLSVKNAWTTVEKITGHEIYINIYFKKINFGFFSGRKFDNFIFKNFIWFDFNYLLVTSFFDPVSYLAGRTLCPRHH